MSGKWIFCRRAHQKWFSFSVLFFPSLFWSSQRALFRQSILRGGQCQFRCYCVNVSMAFPLFYATPYHTHHPSPITAPSKVVFAVGAANRIGSSYISQQFPFGHIVSLVHFFKPSSLSPALSFFFVFFLPFCPHHNQRPANQS